MSDYGTKHIADWFDRPDSPLRAKTGATKAMSSDMEGKMQDRYDAMDAEIAAAVLAERERCARIAETVITGTDNIAVHEARGADKAAAAIRAQSRMNITKDWCERMAKLEGDAEIGAGLVARDPDFA